VNILLDVLRAILEVDDRLAGGWRESVVLKVLTAGFVGGVFSVEVYTALLLDESR
jgi:hypothetical protein